jgi:hypothetical protein
MPDNYWSTILTRLIGVGIGFQENGVQLFRGYSFQ